MGGERLSSPGLTRGRWLFLRRMGRRMTSWQDKSGSHFVFLKKIGSSPSSDPVAKVRACCSAKSSSYGITIADFVTQNAAYDTTGQALVRTRILRRLRVIPGFWLRIIPRFFGMVVMMFMMPFAMTATGSERGRRIYGYYCR